jgi:hypothetical protein
LALAAFALRMSSPLITAIDTETSCAVSVRFCAVTTISSSVVCSWPYAAGMAIKEISAAVADTLCMASSPDV